jgi:hypothetical protein
MSFFDALLLNAVMRAIALLPEEERDYWWREFWKEMDAEAIPFP